MKRSGQKFAFLRTDCPCRQLCVNFWTTFILTAFAAILVSFALLFWTHNCALLEIGSSLDGLAPVGELRTLQLSLLRRELDALRAEAATLSRSLVSNATLAPPLDYDHVDCLLDPRLAYGSASNRTLDGDRRPPDADTTRAEALELLVAFQRARPDLASDARVVVRLAAARYFEAMLVLADTPNARPAVIAKLQLANKTIHRVKPEENPEYARNRTVVGLFYKLCALLQILLEFLL